MADRVGEVIESSTTEFLAQSYDLHEAPPFGSLVRVSDGDKSVYGLVYNVTTTSLDPGRRPIARGRDEDDQAAIFRNNPQLAKLFRTDFACLITGYAEDGRVYHFLPPSPPRVHAFVQQSDAGEVNAYTEALDFLPFLFSAGFRAPVDELAAAFLRQAGQTRANDPGFLVRAGKELAVLLSGDLRRLKRDLEEAETMSIPGEHNNGHENGKFDIEGKRLGMVVGGSLLEGLNIRLDGGGSVEDIAVGRYVVVEGRRKKFFGMITDVSLGAIDKQIEITPPDVTDPFVAEVFAGTSTYGTVQVAPMLTLGLDAASILDGPQPVKTVPSHFSEVREAGDEDVAMVFGREDAEHFYVGTPLDMETKVCLDLKRFVERSSGIFGKSGTGKTFLTRILLIGMVQKGAAANLIFDMHSEYGWQGTFEGGSGHAVKGLKQLFPSKVAVFTMDEESSRRRQVPIDYAVEIGYDQIEPEDIEMLSEILNLSPRAMDAIHGLIKKFGAQRWLETFLALDSAEERDALSEELGHNSSSTLRALYLSLGRLKRLKFLVPRKTGDSVQMILDYLGRGMNVVLEFGRYTDLTAYVLVANVLTRRIHARYVESTERAMGDDKATKPEPLVITIEEAHKFLNPEVAKQTIFGTIAREMRKYNVTLLVVDQRPSGIDEEVMSQIGTRITCLLDNEKDVDAVLTGVPGRNELRTVLAKLESKQQAMVLGHAVPMPVVIRTREYGSAESYREFGFAAAAELKRRAEKDNDDLFGER